MRSSVFACLSEDSYAWCMTPVVYALASFNDCAKVACNKPQGKHGPLADELRDDTASSIIQLSCSRLEHRRLAGACADY